MPVVARPDGAEIFFEVHGGGPALFCGPPLFATAGSDDDRANAKAFIDALGQDYRLLFVDYPYGLGKSSGPIPKAFSVERVTADLLAVADAAGFERFAWYGYSWGAVAGLQLALRTGRLTALVAAGFPPLGGQYELILGSCRRQMEHPPPGLSTDYLRQFVSYYQDLQDYDERQALRRLRMPRMTFVGDRDATDSGAQHYANIDKNRACLEDLGWQVHILPGEDHLSAMRPQQALPLLRAFLDAKLK